MTETAKERIENEIIPDYWIISGQVFKNKERFVKQQMEFTPGDIRENWEENYKQLHAQLTIPKSIAESKWMKHLLSCDLSQFEFERFDEFLNKEDEQFLKWVNTNKNENILYIYLAGKALGVDLVKVVEG